MKFVMPAIAIWFTVAVNGLLSSWNMITRMCIPAPKISKFPKISKIINIWMKYYSDSKSNYLITWSDFQDNQKNSGQPSVPRQYKHSKIPKNHKISKNPVLLVTIIIKWNWTFRIESALFMLLTAYESVSKKTSVSVCFCV